MKNLLILLTFCFGLVACGEGSDTTVFTKDDLCIESLGNKAMVCYGMDKTDAEKTLGTGTKENFWLDYDNGVKVMYRDQKVVMILLVEKSEKSYSTVRGAKVGDLKDSILKLYGEKYPIVREKSPRSVDYVYDLIGKKFIDASSIEKIKLESQKDHLFFSTVLNDNDDRVKMIYLSDLQATMQLR
ncbi:hypothetical protein ACHHV8_33390 [Paenibacillus sp. TAB 01]|uniref:hypothetical protein n=1 Tax=Paenibacillus sp. TAB 01 TaxID=3368988 RepID=UPI00375056C3